MSISAEIVQLVAHVRESIKELATTYHDGGFWGSYYGDMTGYCGIASRFLIALARRNNIYGMKLICGLFDDKTHCWVEYDKFCIDVTIEQFIGKRFRICLIGDDFYRSHYVPEIVGTNAVRHQKQWELGQDYESCSSLLWRIHKANYIKEYNGLVLR